MGSRLAFPLVALLALILAGCSGGGIKSGDIEASQSNERWELRLKIPGEVRAGEMTAVELSLKNASNETLRAHSGCSWFDLLVLDESGTSVFVWSDYIIRTEFGGTAPECPGLFKELAPGETAEQSVSFLVDEPGEYTVRPQPPSKTVGSTGVPIDLSLSVKVRAR